MFYSDLLKSGIRSYARTLEVCPSPANKAYWQATYVNPIENGQDIPGYQKKQHSKLVLSQSNILCDSLQQPTHNEATSKAHNQISGSTS